MLEELGPKGLRAWDLLDAVREDRPSLGDLFDAWRADDLSGIRRRLADVVLELPDVLRLVEGAAPPYEALHALAYGAGLEISASLSR